MFRILDGVIRAITACDESLRLILTTAALVALIMGGLALHNFYGGVLVGLGLGVVLLSLMGVVYEEYLEEQRKQSRKGNK